MIASRLQVTKETPASNLVQAPSANCVREVTSQRSPNPNMTYTDVRAAKEEQFVVINENAATHLKRNASRRGNEDTLYGLVTISSPYSRSVR